MEGALLGAAGLGVVFGVLAYRLRMLNRSGAVAGGLLGASVVGLGGWAWAVPSFAFFLTSSLLSRLGRSRKAGRTAHDAKGDVRDAGQVLANGGVGWAMLLAHAFVPHPVWYWGFLGAFAAAAADTWATEIGTLAGGRPRLITTGRAVPPGTSGAVSVTGSLGALAGALVVWLGALPFAPAGTGVWPAGAAVVAGGFVASFVDSLAGATVQARYVDPRTGAETEREAAGDVPFRLIRGRRWIDNDRVNALCTLTGALLAMACFAARTFAS